MHGWSCKAKLQFVSVRKPAWFMKLRIRASDAFELDADELIQNDDVIYCFEIAVNVIV